PRPCSCDRVDARGEAREAVDPACARRRTDDYGHRFTGTLPNSILVHWQPRNRGMICAVNVAAMYRQSRPRRLGAPVWRAVDGAACLQTEVPTQCSYGRVRLDLP